MDKQEAIYAILAQPYVFSRYSYAKAMETLNCGYADIKSDGAKYAKLDGSVVISDSTIEFFNV